MGCGCKQNNNDTSKVPSVVKTNTEIQFVSPEPLSYTKEDVDRAMAYIKSDKKDLNEREFTYKLYKDNFDEDIQNYCGNVCMERITRRLNKLYERLELYGKATSR
jgi:hypothetical protein